MPLTLSPPQLPATLMRAAPPTPVAQATLLALNRPLAEQLGLDAAALATPAGVAILAGNAPATGAAPVALAYAGHQFGSFVPQLGDGRAILLGEALAADQRRYDVALKGAGRTPFSRGGDGRAALGPVLREYVLSEAMAALGVPTTRSLAAVLTGESVFRETVLPGAVLTRVAASHLRIGTFQYFAARQDRQTLEQLTELSLQRHFPAACRTDGPALALLEGVMAAQARLVAQWMGLGFVHGVMNTDNMAISGETLDYGPCAFLDSFDPARTFSAIDHGGRYAYGNQPQIAQWNVVRLAECLLPLVDADADRATELLLAKLAGFNGLFEAAYAEVFRRKLGLMDSRAGDPELVRALLAILANDRVDFTNFFRSLAESASADGPEPLDRWFADPGLWHGWWQHWQARRAGEHSPRAAQAEAMRCANPAFIARNHRVEEMIAAATAGDMRPFERLNQVLSRPYEDQPEAADLAAPPGGEQWLYRTFCGT